MKIKVNKMSKELIDLNLFLPKFYPKSQQITLKLSPILDNLRSTNIASYHQISDKTLFSQQLQTLPNTDPLKPKPNNNKQFSLWDQKQSIFDNRRNELNFAKTTFVSNAFQQKNRKTFYSTLGTPEHSRTPQRTRNDSFQIRSKTSDKIKSKKHHLMVPGTADLTNNAQQQLEMQKLNIFIKNPQSPLDFDDDICNYIRLKMLTKNPYFSGGKFSKIKKHLVQQINLQEIEKKFFKSTTSSTKYKQFFQRIMFKKKQHSSEKEKFNRTAFNTVSPKKTLKVQYGQRDEKDLEKTLTEFNISKYSQPVERQDSLLSSKGFSQERSKKLTMKAKFLFRKSPIQSNTSTYLAQDLQDLSNKQMEMEVHGKAQSPTLQKYLQARKQKFNVHKDLMKRAYRLDCQ